MKTAPYEIAHVESFTIRTYEIDQQRVCTIPTLIKLMDEAAMQNVINLKLSVWDMEKEKITWVLMRKELKVNRLPILGERIHIYTSPAGFEKFFTYRDYKAFAENGDLLAYSSSTWLLMDTKTRRMTRIPEHILTLTEKMPAPEDCLERPGRKLPKFEKADFVKNYKIGWYNLDFNGHLNNVFYTKWMLQTTPIEVLKNQKLIDFKIEYRVEGLLDDEISAEVQQIDNLTFLHRLVRNGKELAIGKTTWK